MPDNNTQTAAAVDNAPVNAQVLTKYFADAGFDVKKLEVVPQANNALACMMGWNYPDEPRAIMMRTAMAKAGASVSTEYKYQVISDTRGELLSRENMYFAVKSNGELRKFFNEVMDHYQFLLGSVGTALPQAKKQGSAKRPLSHVPAV